MWPGALRATTTVPPCWVIRRSSCTAAIGSGTWYSMCIAKVRAAAPSRSGSLDASAAIRPAPGTRDRAPASMPGDRSAPLRCAAPGQFGKVAAVAAADVGHRPRGRQVHQVQDTGGQVDARVLVGVDRLAGGPGGGRPGVY